MKNIQRGIKKAASQIFSNFCMRMILDKGVASSWRSRTTSILDWRGLGLVKNRAMVCIMSLISFSFTSLALSSLTLYQDHLCLFVLAFSETWEAAFFKPQWHWCEFNVSPIPAAILSTMLWVRAHAQETQHNWLNYFWQWIQYHNTLVSKVYYMIVSQIIYLSITIFVYQQHKAVWRPCTLFTFAFYSLTIFTTENGSICLFLLFIMVENKHNDYNYCFSKFFHIARMFYSSY